MTAPTLTVSSGLQIVTAEALAELAELWSQPAEVLAEAVAEVVPAAVYTYAAMTAAFAADLYDELRGANEIPGDFRAIIPELDLGADALAGWASKPLRLAEPDVEAARYRAEGGLQKRMANAANLVTTTSAAEDPQARGWMRRTRPGACDFCRMVASRGGVFTKASSTFACHENCYCEALPAWGGKALPVGPYKPSDRPQTAEDRARVRQWIADNLDGPTPTGGGRRSKEVLTKPVESKRDIAARQLPGLQRSLADLRARGLKEDSSQIQYHLRMIARFRAQL